MVRKALFLFLIASVGVGGITAGPRPSDYASADPLSTEQESALTTLVQDLETLRSDPNTLKQIKDRIAHQEAAAETELQALDQGIEELEESIARSERLQNDLVDRLKALQTGRILLEESNPEIEAEAPAGTLEDREWWAIQPLVKPTVPALTGDDWSNNPIDRFVYSRLDSNAMRPAPRASRIELARRLYFDLIGLPPTREEVSAFVNDASPDSWGNLVDRLLADPRYGEHWARFWLDLVRYAESDGWKKDSYRPHIWRYRDYVVNAFNDDKPYPEFVREQLAGDEIPGDDPEHRIATGFLRLGIYEYNQRDARSHWNDVLNETTDVTGDVFLGLSMSCCRCHNHKFDPIPQADYYGLRAFFEPLTWRDDFSAVTQAVQARWREQQEIWEEITVEIRAEIDTLCRPYFDRKSNARVDTFPLEIQACFNKPVEERTSWEHQMAYLVERQFEEEGESALKHITKEDKQRLTMLEKRLAEFDVIKPKTLPVVMSITDFAGNLSPTTIPNDREKTPIEPRFLTVLSGISADSAIRLSEFPESSGRRTALAKWIGRSDNPLTTRVIVNRIWRQHFGRGIVPTLSEFGHLGQAPTHPELLDWLTTTFIENGWSMKHLHKLIVMSSTWRQSSNHPNAAVYLAKDPSENLLWRARVRRLKAEEFRDSMLMASGELDDRVGGPSVEADVPRRALYVRSYRNSPDEFLHIFDAANGLASVAQRSNTTTPIQALLMFNGDYTIGRAMKLADRIRKLQRDTPEEALSDAFLLTWGRAPTESELSRAISYVTPASEEDSSMMEDEKLVDLCHVLLNSNEFIYVD